MKTVFLLLTLALLVGCRTSREAAQIKQGILITDQRRGNFLKEWGPPTRTFSDFLSNPQTALEVAWNTEAKSNLQKSGTTTTAADLKVDSDAGSGNATLRATQERTGTADGGGSSQGGYVVKKPTRGRIYDVWVYEQKGVTLVFDRERLSAWRWHDGSKPR